MNAVKWSVLLVDSWEHIGAPLLEVFLVRAHSRKAAIAKAKTRSELPEYRLDVFSIEVIQ